MEADFSIGRKMRAERDNDAQENGGKPTKPSGTRMHLPSQLAQRKGKGPEEEEIELLLFVRGSGR
jgi:hypothetical protein